MTTMMLIVTLCHANDDDLVAINDTMAPDKGALYYARVRVYQQPVVLCKRHHRYLDNHDDDDNDNNNNDDVDGDNVDDGDDDDGDGDGDNDNTSIA